MPSSATCANQSPAKLISCAAYTRLKAELRRSRAAYGATLRFTERRDYGRLRNLARGQPSARGQLERPVAHVEQAPIFAFNGFALRFAERSNVDADRSNAGANGSPDVVEAVVRCAR